MPQMMPLNWLTLFFYFIIMFSFFIIINYYVYLPTLSHLKINKKNLNKNSIWQW